MSQTKKQHTFMPPTIHAAVQAHTEQAHDSYTYVSNIPSAIAENDTSEIHLGVDEAGRGPVLGSMVYAVAYIAADQTQLLRDYEFDDSKKLTDTKRRELFEELCKESSTLHKNVGYAVTNLTARDISSEMLKAGENVNNLNNQAHEVTIDLLHKIINQILSTKKVTNVFIDTVGPPQTYQDKLSKIFPGVSITVAKKADSLYPIVSCASVVAKVTRDIILQQMELATQELASGVTQVGSGYPGDPKTVRWLNSNMNALFGWPQIVRYSWQTAKTLLNSGKYQFVWEDDILMKKKGYALEFSKKEENENDLEKLDISTLWYGGSVTEI